MYLKRENFSRPRSSQVQWVLEVLPEPDWTGDRLPKATANPHISSWTFVSLALWGQPQLLPGRALPLLIQKALPLAVSPLVTLGYPWYRKHQGSVWGSPQGSSYGNNLLKLPELTIRPSLWIRSVFKLCRSRNLSHETVSVSPTEDPSKGTMSFRRCTLPLFSRNHYMFLILSYLVFES